MVRSCDHQGASHPPPAIAPATCQARYKCTGSREERRQGRLARLETVVPITMPKAWDSLAKREAMALELVEDLERMPNFKPKNVLEFLIDCYQPSTAFKWAVTIQSSAKYKHWKEDRMWSFLLHKVLELEKNVSLKRQAIPITPQAIEKIYKACPSAPNVIIAAFLWTSGSRYGDLRWLKVLHKNHIDGDTPLWQILLDFRGSKGDSSGSRGDMKALFIPKAWLGTLELQFVKQREDVMNTTSITTDTLTSHHPTKTKPALRGVESEYMVRKAMRVGDPNYTLHSARRGACHALVEVFTLSETAQLTLHNQTARKEVAGTASYAFGAWFKEERERNQMAMNLTLLLKGGFISHSTMRELFQVHCKLDPMRLRGILEQ